MSWTITQTVYEFTLLEKGHVMWMNLMFQPATRLNFSETRNLLWRSELFSFSNILRLQVFHLFGWFWIMNFIVAFGQCALAGAFASWYWAWDKKTVRFFFFFCSPYNTIIVLTNIFYFYVGRAYFASTDVCWAYIEVCMC